MSVPHIIAQMGDRLRREVEHQLLLDLDHYRPGSSNEKLTIDWSNRCQERHCTDVLGGTLESMSDVFVRCPDGKAVADGWIDFVHRGGDLPLFVFWLFLDLIDDEGRSADVKEDAAIPSRIWSKLPASSRDACCVTDRYDAHWKDDPSVKIWRRDAG
jgi:hypothetical protein